jgi:CHAT domain-containing protein
MLRLPETRKTEHNEAIVLADPDFDFGTEGATPGRPPHIEAAGETTELADSNDRGDDLLNVPRFDRLLATRNEGQWVAKTVGVECLLGSDALEGRVRSSHSPWILHLATHGFFLPNLARDLDSEPAGSNGLSVGSGAKRLYGTAIRNPLLRSGVALAGANTWLNGGTPPPEAEDGLLTAEDVSGLDLLDTELVVLSACETGLGEIRTGEGVFGLRRAFVLAGAKTLIMSLWKVPDEQTRELMEEFYRRLMSGESRSGALRRAQMAIRDRYADPGYWGAFVCQGDFRPIIAAVSA